MAPIPLRKTRSVGLSLTQYFAGSPAQAALVSSDRLILFFPLRSALSSRGALARARLGESRQLIVIAKLFHIISFVMDDFLQAPAWRSNDVSLAVTDRHQGIDGQRLGNFLQNHEHLFLLRR